MEESGVNLSKNHRVWKISLVSGAIFGATKGLTTQMQNGCKMRKKK